MKPKIMMRIEAINECAVTLTLEVINGKWKPVIIYALSKEDLRFNEIWVFIPRVSKKVLTTSLKELEMEGIISRTCIAESPPKTVYSLTEKGHSLIPVFETIQQWGKSNFEGCRVFS